jgi:hypothetical protein
MGFFDGVKPATDKLPMLKSFGKEGSGIVECTRARLEQGQRPETAGRTFLIVDGVNVDHPACAPGTPVTVMIVDLADRMYSGKDIGRFLTAACGDASPAISEQFFGAAQGVAGVRIGVATQTEYRGAKSAKAGQPFMAVRFYPVPAPTAPSPAAPPPSPAAAEEWFDFPAGDSRHGREQYNRGGVTRTIGA